MATLTTALAAHASPDASRGRPEPDGTALFEDVYPIEVAVPEHAARFHWLDSLAALDFPGASAGKTVDAHRRQYLDVLGRPTPEDRTQLRRFAEVRVHEAERVVETRGPDGVEDLSALLVAFLEATDETAALERAAGRLPPADASKLSAALDHFREPYARIWDGGRWSRGFLDDARGGRQARRLGRMLGRVADFYGVGLPLHPRPRLVLVPTPPGHGTHATAQGRNLLVELRPRDRMSDAASVIVHENAHLLFARMPANARRAVEAVFLDRGETGRRAWTVLVEALPTALGQGVADRRFRPRSWSVERAWYHRRDVDAYAKAIYPIVARALRRGDRFGPELAREFLERFPGETSGVPVTPR